MASTFIRLLALCIASIGVFGCGSDQSNPAISLNKAIFAKIASPAGQSSTSSAAPDTLTRAALAGIGQPVKRVTVENYGAKGLIVNIATNGNVETWSSTDNRVLSMRNGIIIASRGFGGDLMSAVVPQLTQVAKGGQTYQRRHVVLDGEDKPISLYFNCETRTNGATSITVVERSYVTQHITESCSGTSGGFSNEFWVEHGGILRRSRQWINESVGFVVIEHLQ